MVYPDREVYGRPPLVLVAAEIRFSDAPRLRQQETLDAVSIAFDRRFPLSGPLGGVSLVSAGPGAAPQLTQRRGVVLRNTESTEALTATPTSLTYETTDYRGFAAARDVLADGCRTLTGLDVRPALTRIGLRYINEVRVPDPPADMRGWSRWIDPALLAPLTVGADRPVTRGIQGAATFDLERGLLNAQHAAFTDGATSIPAHLRRSQFTPGPFFGLDFDGFTEFGADPAVLLDAAVVVDVLPALHAAAGSAFQRSITDEARGLFRGSGLVSSIGTPPMGSAGRQGV
jgi:uncharacterized protein (TIGR04255 family)